MADLVDFYAYVLRWAFFAFQASLSVLGILATWGLVLLALRRAIEQTLCLASLIEAIKEARLQGRAVWTERWLRWCGRDD